MEKIRQYIYYFIIGIISLIALTFLPMIGSAIGMGWNVPTTTVGWVVWAAVKLIVAVINILIFHSFMCQAKLNIKDNENYKEAMLILSKAKKEHRPRSPRKWNAEQYGKKGVTIFVTSALATVALTQAILAFDWVSMLTYLFTIIMCLIFGVLQMKSAENYWIEEFWQYAQIVRDTQMEEAELEELKKEEEINDEEIPDDIYRGVGIPGAENGESGSLYVDLRSFIVYKKKGLIWSKIGIWNNGGIKYYVD